MLRSLFATASCSEGLRPRSSGIEAAAVCLGLGVSGLQELRVSCLRGLRGLLRGPKRALGF